MRAVETHAADTDRASAWVAAYVLGLAYSSRSEHERVACLRDAVDERPELVSADVVRDARLRLREADVAEPTVQCEALRLLDRALAADATDADGTDARGTAL